MKYKVFLDTNIFIYAFEYRESNSATILTLLSKGEIDAIISPRVIKEVKRYFEKYYTFDLARKWRKYLFDVCKIVHSDESMIKQYQGKIKEKDLEQLVVVKQMGLRYLIAYDRDFVGFEEYIKPKSFLQMLCMKTQETEY